MTAPPVGSGDWWVGTDAAGPVLLDSAARRTGLTVRAASGTGVTPGLLMPLALRSLFDAGPIETALLLVVADGHGAARTLAPLCAALGRPFRLLDPWTGSWGWNPLETMKQREMPLLASVLLSATVPTPSLPPSAVADLATLLVAAQSGAIAPIGTATLPMVADLLLEAARGEMGPVLSAFYRAGAPAPGADLLRLGGALQWLTRDPVRSFFDRSRPGADPGALLRSTPRGVICVGHPLTMQGSGLVAGVMARLLVRTRNEHAPTTSEPLTLVLDQAEDLAIPELADWARFAPAHRLHLLARQRPESTPLQAGSVLTVTRTAAGPRAEISGTVNATDLRLPGLEPKRTGALSGAELSILLDSRLPRLRSLGLSLASVVDRGDSEAIAVVLRRLGLIG